MKQADELAVRFHVISRRKVGSVKALRKRLKEVRKKLEETEDEAIIVEGHTSTEIYSIEAHTRTQDCWFSAVIFAAYHDGKMSGVYVMQWWDSSAQGPFLSFYVLPCDKVELEEYSLAEACALWALLDFFCE